MISCCSMLIIFRLITGSAVVSGCIVHPTSVVVDVGERVLVKCTANEGGSITSWDIGINTVGKTIIYTLPLYKQDGSIGTPETISDGYFVTRPADNETILQMSKTTLSQAGLYTCTCGFRVTAVTTVVVLVSEPTFTTNYSGAYGIPVTFSCSLSFNASSDVSCELRMQDASGSTVARRNESTMNNALISCNLEHTVIANASSDQNHTCNVTLSNKGDMIYSRFLNAKVECLTVTVAEAISSTADFLSREETSENHAIGLSVGLTILTFVIVIALVCCIVRLKNRDNMLCQPTEQPSCCPQWLADRCDTNDIGCSVPIYSVTHCSNVLGQPMEQPSYCPSKPADRCDANDIGDPIPNDSVTHCSNVVRQDKKLLKENELILFENDLYTESPKQLDPSDGYYKDDFPMYTEVIR